MASAEDLGVSAPPASLDPAAPGEASTVHTENSWLGIGKDSVPLCGLVVERLRRRRKERNWVGNGGGSLFRRYEEDLAAAEDDRGGMCGAFPKLGIDSMDEDGNDEPTATAGNVATSGSGAVPPSPIPASVLSSPRQVAIVTTAAMPWRTGTAVNPLLRALYLVRYQSEMRQSQKLSLLDSLIDDEMEEEGVALFVPWLESSEERETLYANARFPDRIEGMRQQEAWIRDWAGERCGMAKEAEKLTLVFYPAFYLAGFGSIFPKVDLCNFVARSGYADVVILEEPEHLNWFRMPDVSGKGSSDSLDKLADQRAEEEPLREPSGVFGQKVEVSIDDAPRLVPGKSQTRQTHSLSI